MINNNQGISGKDYRIRITPIFSNSNSNIYECTKGKDFPKSLCAKVSFSNEHEIDYKRIYQITQNSKNQNLVPIYHIEYNRFDKSYSIIMKKCKENLESQHFEFNEAQITEFLNEFITGYKCLYDSKLFHGKINANNIFIIKQQDKNQYKIGDIASYATSNNTNIGYIAPEIFPMFPEDELFLKIQGNQNQVASDIYSLGMVLIRLIYGKLPYECTRDQVIQFHNSIKSQPYIINNTPSIIYKQQPISEELLIIIQRMIHYNPQDRLSFEELCKFQDEYLNPTFSSKQNQPPPISSNAHQLQQSQLPSNFFKNLSEAKILPENAGVYSSTSRLRAIKRIAIQYIIQEAINLHWNSFKNYLNHEKEHAYIEIQAENKQFLLDLINSYNNTSSELGDQEITFIYCLVAKSQGYNAMVKKPTSDQKAELLNV